MSNLLKRELYLVLAKKLCTLLKHPILSSFQHNSDNYPKLPRKTKKNCLEIQNKEKKKDKTRKLEP